MGPWCLRLVLLGCLLLPAVEAFADLYQCTDPKTRKVLTTNAPQDYKGMKCKLFMRTEPIGSNPKAGTQPAPGGGPAAGRAPDRWTPPGVKTQAAPAAPAASTASPLSGPPPATLSAAPGATPSIPAAPEAPAQPPATQRSGRERFDEVIALASRTYDIPEPFIRAVIEVESGYNPRALSRVGAMGMMQLMPGTAKDLGVANPWDPEQNIMGGTKLLRWLANRFDGDMVKVLSAYHAGGGVTSQKDGTPYVGTDGYVRKVLKHFHRIKQGL
jgi:soluble lytic murein transglycosylase-like protein